MIRIFNDVEMHIFMKLITANSLSVHTNALNITMWVFYKVPGHCIPVNFKKIPA